jgi:hypothetical protein
MISGKTKEDLLLEIAKFGNVYLSCLKVGINASTYYRWKEKDELFKEEAEEAERDGRRNICHVAEHALLKNVKEGQQRAIEYTLNHNSEIYKKKETSNVVIVHKKELVKPQDESDTNSDVSELRDVVSGIKARGLPYDTSDLMLIDTLKYIDKLEEEEKENLENTSEENDVKEV